MGSVAVVREAVRSVPVTVVSSEAALRNRLNRCQAEWLSGRFGSKARAVELFREVVVIAILSGVSATKLVEKMFGVTVTIPVIVPNDELMVTDK